MSGVLSLVMIESRRTWSRPGARAGGSDCRA